MKKGSFLLLLVVIFIFTCSLFLEASVPEFNLKFGTSVVKSSSYLPFQGKILIKMVQEKRIVIYGDEAELLIISETPFMEDETRYRVNVTKNGEVEINYYLDENLNSEIPLPLKKRMKEEDYDKKTINLELPFILKNRDKKIVYVNHRLEISVPYRGSKKWFKEEAQKIRKRSK
jgi:hypothetical protein